MKGPNVAPTPFIVSIHEMIEHSLENEVFSFPKSKFRVPNTCQLHLSFLLKEELQNSWLPLPQQSNPCHRIGFQANLIGVRGHLMASDAMKKNCPDLIRGRNPKATLVTPGEDSLILVLGLNSGLIYLQEIPLL